MTEEKKHQKIIVLGGGESGSGAAALAALKGHDVFLSEAGIIKDVFKERLIKYGINYEEGGHNTQNFIDAGLIIKSPGIPESTEIMKAVRKAGIEVISEIEFASRYTDKPKICITGSNGKTTTALLTGHIFRNAGLNAIVAGNIGKSFAWEVCKGGADIYILEISSFQLDDMFEFKAETAIITNITPDHLDRYEYSFRNYINAKLRITRNQTSEDALIYCLDDDISRQELCKDIFPAKKYTFSIAHPQKADGACLENTNEAESTKMKENTNKKIKFNIHKEEFDMTLESLALQGRHNVYNSMAAGIAARIYDIRKSIIKESLSDFQNVEHRLEFVANIHGIAFINDSKATNINSTWYALESVKEPIVWIAGGIDKGNDYETIRAMVRSKVKAIVCLGIDNSRIISAFKDDVETIVEVKSAEEAVLSSYQLAKKGESVLLSPACASFDLFLNYEERGKKFKAAVNQL